MNKTVLRVTTLFILLLAIILLPSITSAETNSIIVKQTKDYIIYNESMMNEEFTFAFSDTNEKTNLIFFPSAKDANSTDAKNVAYVDDTTRSYVSETSDTYFFVRNKKGEYVIDAEKINLKNAFDKELVETTTKRIKVDTTKSNVTTATIDGVKTEVTKGKVEITDNSDAQYSYILIKLPTNEENNYSKLMNLAEKISNKDELDKLNFMQKLELMNSFYAIYTQLEPKQNDSAWLPVENLEILQPQDSKNGEQYIVFIKSANGNETTIDAQFMTCYDKYNPIYEKETVTIKETSKLPVTYDSIALIVIFAIVIVAIVIVLVVRKKASKKEENK